jgi:hypothetical protein
VEYYRAALPDKAKVLFNACTRDHNAALDDVMNSTKTRGSSDQCRNLPLAAQLPQPYKHPLDVPVQRRQPECMHKFPLFLPLSRPNQALGCYDRPFDWELRGDEIWRSQ